METVNHKIRRLIRYYEHLTGSRDPVTIARYAGIQIAVLPLGNISGNYKLLKRKRWIFINEDIPSDSYLTSNNRKINIYSEDAEARYFIRHMLADYKDHFRLLDITLIRNTDITLENWHEFSLYRNNDYLQDKTSVQIGFAGLFLNRTNFSGILKANPLGGLNQQSQYPINCRFNKDKIINSIQQLSLYGNKITLYNLDAIDFMKQALRYKRNRKTFVYIDPPYYKEGANLYRCYYTHEQHMLLSKFILSKTYPWLISYDNAEEIRKMYKQLSPLTIHMDYSVHTSRNAEELLISNIKIPPMEPSSTTIEPLIG